MKFIGFKEIAISSMVVDAAEIRRRAGLQHVIDLGSDAENNGGEYMHPPVVRDQDRLLIAGRDRVAGAVAKKRKRLWVHLVECDDVEAKVLELAENLHRRTLDQGQRSQAIAALVKLREQQECAADESRRAAGETVSDAPQHSPKARARTEVAKTAGVSHGAVKQAEKRAAKSAEEAELTQREVGTAYPAQKCEVALPEGFQAYGVPVPAEDRETISDTVGWLRGMEGEARQIVGAMTDAEKHQQWAVSPSHIQAIRERAQALGHALREAMPSGLCPYCKTQPKLMAACAGCGGVGVVGRHAGDHVPRELLGSEVVMVAVDGQVVPLNGALPSKKNGKAIRVEVVDEVGAAPRELTLEPDASEELF